LEQHTRTNARILAALIVVVIFIAAVAATH
jgi:hypothetical protein